MKITIQFEGRTSVVEDPEVVDLEQALSLFEDALCACGYRFNGELAIIEEDTSNASDN